MGYEWASFQVELNGASQNAMPWGVGEGDAVDEAGLAGSFVSEGGEPVVGDD
jgi:hypothetical protein